MTNGVTLTSTATSSINKDVDTVSNLSKSFCAVCKDYMKKSINKFKLNKVKRFFLACAAFFLCWKATNPKNIEMVANKASKAIDNFQNNIESNTPDNELTI